MKVWAYVALAALIIGAGGTIYKLIGNAAITKIELATANATIDQLQKDAVSVKELEKQNEDLQLRIDHAKTIYAQVKDPSGCFRTPVPDVAAVELWNLYRSFTGEAGYETLRKGKTEISLSANNR